MPSGVLWTLAPPRLLTPLRLCVPCPSHHVLHCCTTVQLQARNQNPEQLNLDRRKITVCPLLEGEGRLRLLNYQNNQIHHMCNFHKYARATRADARAHRLHPQPRPHTPSSPAPDLAATLHSRLCAQPCPRCARLCVGPPQPAAPHISGPVQ